MLKQASSAVIWSAFEVLIRQGSGVVISIVLARLLLPKDFGTVAVLSLFIGMAMLFVNAGFSQALIQKKEISAEDTSTVFWFNIVVAVFMAALLYAVAPSIARFFALPVLDPITKVLGLNIVIAAIGSIHSTLLRKTLNFRSLMFVGVISTLVAGVVSIALASIGYGLWALVTQTVVGTTVNTLLLWLISSWRPRLTFSRDSFKDLFGFGKWLLASSFLDTLYQHGYTLLLGKFYGVHQLGIYNRADNTQQLVTGTMVQIISRVAFPLFSSVNSNKQLLRQGVQIGVRVMMFITVPTMVGLALLAEPLMVTVFGEVWRESAPVMQILCISGAMYPLQVINLNILNAQGHSRLFFRLEVMKKTIGVIALIVGCFFGIIGIAWARVFSAFIALLLNTYYTGKYLEYGFSAQCRDSFLPLCAAGVMGCLLLLSGDWYPLTDIQQVIYFPVVGAAVYLLINMTVKDSVMYDAYTMLKRLRSR